MCIPKIKNAYENIVQACEKRLKELYPMGVPEFVNERYQTELKYLKASEFIDDFEIFRLLNEEGKKTSQYISLRGTISGSILVYLLGNNRINPLQSHYYCEKCGYTEIVDAHLFGIDLPKIICPVCGKELLGDGYRLPIESVWGIDGKRNIGFEYNVSEEFFIFIKRMLQRIYPNNQIVEYGRMGSSVYSRNFLPETCTMLHAGYVILPENRTMEDYSELVTYLENGDACIAASYSYMLENYNLKEIILHSCNYAKYLMQLQRKNGIYIQDIEIEDLRELEYYNLINTKVMWYEEEEILKYEKPKNFYEMINYTAMPHNATIHKGGNLEEWYGKTKKKILNMSEFKQFPCRTREDFFEYFMDCGLDRTTAFKLSEDVRKGKCVYSPILEEFPIPEELKTLGKMYDYIFPRAHIIENFLTYARLAYYMKLDSKVYSSVVRERKKMHTREYIFFQ